MKKTQKHNVLFQHQVEKLLRRKSLKSGFTAEVAEMPRQKKNPMNNNKK